MNCKLPFFIQPDDAPSKQAVLKAALELFVKHGLCETSIRAIADQAGYSNPVIFKFFDSKESLASYLFEQCYRRFALAIASAQRDDSNADTNLQRVIARCCELIDDAPEAFLFVQDNIRLLWPTMPASVRKTSMIDQLRHLVESAKREGLASPDIATDIVVAGIAGLFAQFSRMLHFGEFRGSASAWQPQLERTIIAMLRG